MHFNFFKKNKQAQVELFYWQPKSGQQNFGDYLSYIIVSAMLQRKERFLGEPTRVSKRLLAVGSILHFAKNSDVVWGSGVNGKVNVKAHNFNDLDVRAVRGPLTHEFLQRRGIVTPRVYGDPVLLLPNLLPTRFERRSDFPLGIVPNLHDIGILHGSEVISPLLPWFEVVERILRCEFIVASSLHGIIVAEAYGIPARYLRLTNTESIFKFEDYYKGTGREFFEYARTVDEAVNMGGMPLPEFDCERLMQAFPYDLWL